MKKLLIFQEAACKSWKSKSFYTFSYKEAQFSKLKYVFIIIRHFFAFSGIYPSTLTNVRFLEKIEFYKGKSDYKTIVFAALGLGQNPGGLSGGKDLNILAFQQMSLRWLKKLYLWPKKL